MAVLAAKGNCVAMGIEWFKEMKEYMPFPNDYLVFDTETSGLNWDADLLLQFGYCRVVNNKPDVSGSVILNWPKCAAFKDQMWLKSRLAQTQINMAAKGKVFHFPYDRLADEGDDPIEALGWCKELLVSRLCSGGHFVTHNGFGLDIPITKRQFKRFLGYDFCFSSDCVLDTGLTEKAYQLYTYPTHKERLDEFYTRVYHTRQEGLSWSLDKLVKDYGLDRRYNLDTRDAHDAEYDSYVTHLLFEEYRRLCGAD